MLTVTLCSAEEAGGEMIWGYGPKRRARGRKVPACKSYPAKFENSEEEVEDSEK